MIRLESVGRDFQVGSEKVHALRDVSLAIEAGEYVSVMGPSGSGKSTLLHVLGLLDRPTAGRYELDGSDVTTLGDRALAALRRKHIGFVFQAFHLVPRLSCFENAALPLILDRVAPGEREARVRAALASLGLEKRMHHRPTQLSGGERQRAAIARAIVMRPALLLADEPTGNLDSTNGAAVMELLRELHRDGATIIMVTHDPRYAEHAERTIHLFDGQIVRDERSAVAAELERHGFEVV
jgi:putative ABC transport system ATP-binding protein